MQVRPSSQVASICSIALTLLLLGLTACAGMDVDRVGRRWGERSGFRYYLPHPYLLVTREKDKPGDTVLFEQVIDTLLIAPAGRHRASLKLKADDLVGKSFKVSVLPTDEATFATEAAGIFTPLRGYTDPSNGVPVLGSFIWTVSKPKEILFLVPSKLRDIARGEVHPVIVAFEALSDPSLKGTLKLSLAPVNSAAPDGNAVAVQGGANAGPQPGATTLSVVYLPDKAREMAVERTEGLGSFDMTLKLKDGWMLTDIGSAGKSEVPETISATAALVGSLAQLAPSVASFLSYDTETKQYDKREEKPLLPGLYYMKFDDKGVFQGLISVGALQ